MGSGEWDVGREKSEEEKREFIEEGGGERKGWREGEKGKREKEREGREKEQRAEEERGGLE